jgi:hypothetical protein
MADKVVGIFSGQRFYFQFFGAEIAAFWPFKG